MVNKGKQSKSHDSVLWSYVSQPPETATEAVNIDHEETNSTDVFWDN